VSEPAPIRDTSKPDAVYALACELLPALRAVARSKGYALACHGSFARDGRAHLDAKLAELQRMLDASYAETIKQSKRAQVAEEELAKLRGATTT
jgi:hypothetical protein